MKPLPDPSPAAGGALTRRAFVGRSATAAAAFMILPGGVLGRAGAPGANSRLNVAGIGIGGQGRGDLAAIAATEDIVALCDVDDEYAAAAFADYPGAARYKDFRVMLEKEKTIDAVVIATPDHVHAVATLAALQHGRHVYCEKPLTRTVVEARTVARAARSARVATQMGNQGMAFEGHRLIDEWIAAGAIGEVREVHVWSDRPTQRGAMPLWWPQGIERPTDTPPVPATLDWDLWLGPAPFRPYHPAYAPFRWRGWWDFGTGGLGDMGIHNLAPVFSALKLGPPTSLSASSTPRVADSVPLACTVHYQFPARGALPPVGVHWYDGGLLPERPPELPAGEELDPEDGILFVGSRGKLLVKGWGGSSPRLLPAALDEEYRRAVPTRPPPIAHHEDWIRACKGGPAARSDFRFAGPLTEAVLLGSVCVRHGGRRLLWDSAQLRFTNDETANPLLHYAYRPGWTL